MTVDGLKPAVTMDAAGNIAVDLSALPTVEGQPFYADRIHLEEVEYGVALTAVQHAYGQRVAAMVRIALDFASWPALRDSLGGIGAALRTNAPHPLAECPPPAELPPSFVAMQACLCRVSASYSGALLEFYYISPRDVVRAKDAGGGGLPVVPLLSIATLPGRLNHLLPKGDA